MDINFGLVILLMLLGIIDLIVGVSNDSVNFLHSAFGSRISSRKTILWIASIGLIIGSFFSFDMIDLTRKGLVSTSLFSLNDLAIILFAVMITDIIIIDICNTFGIPTSTTTALIIELVGATLAVIVAKNGVVLEQDINRYININHLFLILAGILISIFLAFIAGLIAQFAARIIFSFNFNKQQKFLLPLSGSLSTTIIFYFIVRKALHLDFIDNENWLSFLNTYLNEVLISIFGTSFFIFLVLTNLFSGNVLKYIVLLGTFALALSFAANDLVNFIGIPLIGISSLLTNFKTIYNTEANAILPIILGSSGIILSATIFISKRSKAVVDTELFLGRQFSGYERFEPSYFSRSLVRHVSNLSNRVTKHLPGFLTNYIKSRYKITTQQLKEKQTGNVIYFDAIRATVNLVVSTILILAGTWSHIPLSTTFIVFLVAMGTSLADQAWTQESAVYRISGVLTILSSWFLVSCFAFIGAFILSLTIWHGGYIALIIIIILMGLMLYKSSKYFRFQQKKNDEFSAKIKKETETSVEWIYDKGGDQFKKYLLEASKIYFLAINGLIEYDLLQLKEASQKSRELSKRAKSGKQDLFQNLVKMPDKSIEPGHNFIQGLDYVSELSGSLKLLVESILEHIDNNHKGLNVNQADELNQLMDDVTGFFNYLVHVVKDARYYNLSELVTRQHILTRDIDTIQKSQIKRLKSDETKTKISLIYIEILSETKNIILYSLNIVKSHRDFINSF